VLALIATGASTVIEHHLEHDGTFVFVTMSGLLADDETYDWFRGFIESLEGHRGVSGLIDTRTIERFDLSAPTVQRMSELAKAAVPQFMGSRWAVIAPEDVVYGMSRMFEIRTAESPWQFRVFRTEQEARDWLELPPDPPGT
jgi:hypothetical protein